MKSLNYIYKLSAALAILSCVISFGGCSKEQAFEKAAAGEAEVNFKPAVRSAARTKGASATTVETGVFTCEEGISIPFTCTVEDAASSFATKGELTNTSGETMLLNEAGVSRFRICAVNNDNTVFIPCSKNVNYIDGKWQTERTYIWKEAGEKRFFACANFFENVTMTVNDDSSICFKTALVIPDKAEEQKDFIFAQTISDGDSDGDGVLDGTISLQFDHICTSVIFKCGTMTGVEKIKSISIEGVTGCREYEVVFDVDGSLTEETTITDTYTKTVYTIADGELPAVGETIGEPFILIPQGLEGQPVTLRILATVYGRDYELISKVESGSWNAGKANIYTIGYTAQFDPADDDPLCFTSEGPQAVCFHKKQADGSTANLEYSTDGTSWTAWADPAVPVEFNGALYLRGLNTNGFYAGEKNFEGATEGFVFSDQTVPVTLSGDQMSIIDYRVKVQVPGRACFALLYAQQACIKSAADLKLPATELTDFCYVGMFANCTNLEYGPALPAMRMRTDCYGLMFSTCTALKECPALPATELAKECYALMFYQCASLTETCELPASKVWYQSYMSMFAECTMLEKACALPATELGEDCYQGMFNGCVNLTEAPAILPATQPAPGCYSRMFHKCTSLEAAPALPAAVLVQKCYKEMFKGCSSLTHIQMLATDISATDCLDEWVKNVADHGTFIKDGGMNDIPVNSISGIPVGWTVVDMADVEPLCFTSDGVQSVKFTYTKIMPVLEYSFDKTVWTTWGNTDVQIEFGEGSHKNLYVRGNNPDGLKQTEVFSPLGIDFVRIEFSNQEQPVAVSGNIMSLIDYTTEVKEIPCAGCFAGLFGNQQCITSAPQLPATTLTEGCYAATFGNCTGLVSAPVLPAEKMEKMCYFLMFIGCTGLNSAPALDATSLGDECYYGMFGGCTGLTSSPVLPSTTLATECYMHMFSECTNLESAPALPATELKNGCYSHMFYGCTKLTAAPELPAKELVKSCYYSMFCGCTNLSYIKMIANDISGEKCLTDWVKNVADDGTFIKAAEMTDLPDGNSGIPSGWYVQNSTTVE